MSSCRPDHVGPVLDRKGTQQPDRCLCCDTDMSLQERLRYWKRQVTVQRIKIAAYEVAAKEPK